MPKKYNYIRRTITWEGKRYTVRGKTEQEAADKLAELKLSLKRGEKTIGEESTVDRWFNEWIEMYKKPAGLTLKSLGMYTEKYNLYIKPAIGTMKLKDVRPVHLQRILNSQEGKSKSHVSKIRLVLKEMFSRARKDRLLIWDPAEDLVLPSVTEGKRRSITDEEREHILAVAETHRAGLWVLSMLYAGLRPGETIPLVWNDIDFKKKEIRIYKAAESGTGAVKSPKTEAGYRDIPIHQDLLWRLKQARGKPLDPVFPNMWGNVMDAKAVRRLWNSFKRALDVHMGAKLYRNQIVESKVADDLTPYCLRHTFCTDLQRAGVPINVAKELMGHSDINITANIYTHKDQAVLHKNIKKLAVTKGVTKKKNNPANA